jgi:predicted dehydrogenase
MKLKVGIIGAGAIVETNHLPALVTLDDFEVSWIYDKNAERITLASNMYNLTSISYEQLESSLREIDICLIAIPYGVRKPYIDLCRKFGKAIVVEKPFAFSENEHMEYANGFEPWKISINFQRRFYNSVILLKNIIKSNIFGSLLSIKFVQGNFTLKGGAGYLSDATLAGGGVIAESAIHGLDIISFITQSTGVKLKELKSLHKKGIDYDSYFESILENSKGEIHVACEISTLRNLRNGLHLQFDNACVFSDLSPEAQILVTKNNDVNFEISHHSLSSKFAGARKTSETFLLFWEKVAEGIKEKTINETNACAVLVTTQWLQRIYQKINLR